MRVVTVDIFPSNDVQSPQGLSGLQGLILRTNAGQAGARKGARSDTPNVTMLR